MSSSISLPPSDLLWTFLAYDIGLDPMATISVKLINLRPANDTFLMILTHSQLLEWHQKDAEALSMSEDVIGYNSYLVSAWRQNFAEELSVWFTATSSKRDRYHVGVMNAHKSVIQLQGAINLVQADGNELPVEQQGLVPVLMFTSALYASLAWIMCSVLVTSWRRTRTRIHTIIVLVVLLKGLATLLHWCDLLFVSGTGKTRKCFSLGWLLVDKVQTMAELMMFLMISLGWKVMRPSLSVTEVRATISVALFSLHLGVAELACSTAATCAGYQLGRYILHAICTLVIMVAVNFNLHLIQSQISEAPATVEVGDKYTKRGAYRAFRLVVLSFIMAPTVEVCIKVTCVPWDAIWVFALVQHLRCLVLYAVVAYFFRPSSPPLRVLELTCAINSDDDSSGNSNMSSDMGYLEAVGDE